jgi:HD superfamily phosphohydrolase
MGDSFLFSFSRNGVVVVIAIGSYRQILRSGAMLLFRKNGGIIATMSEDKSKQTEMPLRPAEQSATDRGHVPEYLVPKKRIQIAVSGGVPITGIEQQIIDTPDFQRLRGIRQLGLAHLVYPTALHTRFDHSLGTLHMAAHMVQAIRDNANGPPDERVIGDEQVALTRLYALLHDITHIPFGHSIEDELELLTRHDQNEERIQHFLGPKSEIGGIISKNFGPKFLEKLLHIYRWDDNPETRQFPPDDVFIHDLVSNTVCADLLDYLQRDNHFCNLGVSLEYHFIKYLYLHNDEHGQRRVFVRLWKNDASGGRPRRDTLTDLCRLLETRYLIAERVYFHHAKVAASVMLGRAIQEAQLAEEIDEQFMWTMTDEMLLAHLHESGSELAKRLAMEVSHRRLYKEYHTFGWEDVEKPQAQSHLTNQYDDVIQVRVGTAKARLEFENQIADIIGAEPGDVLIYAPTRKMNRKEAEMKVLWKGHPAQFKDIDDPVVRPRLNATIEAHKLLWSIRLLVRRSLTPAQQQLAMDLCDIELLSDPRERPEKQRVLYNQIVSKALAAENRIIPSLAKEYGEKVGEIVQELVATGHKGGSFSQRLRVSINLHFPQAGA